MNDEQALAFARQGVRASVRHAIGSVVLGVACLAYFRIERAPSSAYLFVLAMVAFLVAYNLVRITRARRAQTSVEAARAHVLAQKRSHLVRGRITLIVVPIVVAATWLDAWYSHVSPLSWVVLSAMTLFFAGGMVWWVRALRRVRRWSVES